MELPTLARTRRSLHGVAEAVLAGPQFRAHKDVRLRVTPGGFGTTRTPDLRVDGGTLVAGTARIPLAGHTYATLARAAGVEASLLQHDVYADGPDIHLDDLIELDPDAARHLIHCFALGDEALHRLDPEADRILWPEHFDVASALNEINYGISPGDSYLAEPYAYVGPWPVPQGEFWNAPFGAARLLSQLPDAGAVLAFFRQGQAEAGQHRTS